MSDLLDEAEIEFPKTVSACHAEIRRLSNLIAEADKAIDDRDGEIDDLQSELDEIEEKRIVIDEETEQAIHAFLDEVERIGPLQFDVPQGERANRAIVALHDVVGRNP